MEHFAIVDDVPVDTAVDDDDAVYSSHAAVSDDEDNTTSHTSVPYVYPVWLYTSHPSDTCEKTGNSCPSLNGWAIGGIIIGVFIVIIAIIALIAKVADI